MGIFDGVITNLFINYLKDANPENCQQAILENRSLFINVSDEEWEKHRRRLRLVPGLNLSYEAVLVALTKNRQDLLAVICTVPGGVPWLEEQVRTCQQKLGLQQKTFTNSFSSQ